MYDLKKIKKFSKITQKGVDNNSIMSYNIGVRKNKGGFLNG